MGACSRRRPCPAFPGLTWRVPCLPLLQMGVGAARQPSLWPPGQPPPGGGFGPRSGSLGGVLQDHAGFPPWPRLPSLPEEAELMRLRSHRSPAGGGGSGRG